LKAQARAACLLALLGCGGGQNVNGTLVLVEVGSDLAIPTQLDNLEITVRTDGGGTASRAFRVAATSDLPARLGVVPEGKTSGAFTVTVQAYAGDKLILTQLATTAFVPNEARKLELFLGAGCVALDPTCGPDKTCRGNACVRFADGVTLLPYLADAGASVPPEGGAVPPDTAAPQDMSMSMPPPDASTDTAAVPPDAGPTPDLPPGACGRVGDVCCATGDACNGAATCSGGLCQCASPAIMCAGFCVNPNINANHCRVCNHSCQGGACTGGNCAPVMVASAQDNPTYLAVDDAHLFWRRGNGSAGAIVRVRKDGSAPLGDLIGMLDGHGTLAGDGTRLYYFANNNMWSCAVPTCGTPVRLAPTTPTMSLGISIIDAQLGPAKSRLFWSDYAKLYSVPVAGGATQTHLSGNFPTTTMAIDNTFMYYAERDVMGVVSLYRLTVNNPPMRAPLIDFASGFPRQIAVTGDRLLWVQTGSVNSVVLDPPSRVPPAPLATGTPTRMAIDGSTVFWADFMNANTGRILSCATTGCRGVAPAVLASTCGPNYVAADPTTVYWSCAGTGQVWKVAR
jgi:hypothetical protein